jgi:hypothetical protein
MTLSRSIQQVNKFEKLLSLMLKVDPNKLWHVPKNYEDAYFNQWSKKARACLKRDEISVEQYQQLFEAINREYPNDWFRHFGYRQGYRSIRQFVDDMRSGHLVEGMFFEFIEREGKRHWDVESIALKGVEPDGTLIIGAKKELKKQDFEITLKSGEVIKVEFKYTHKCKSKTTYKKSNVLNYLKQKTVIVTLVGEKLCGPPLYYTIMTPEHLTAILKLPTIPRVFDDKPGYQFYKSEGLYATTPDDPRLLKGALPMEQYCGVHNIDHEYPSAE